MSGNKMQGFNITTDAFQVQNNFLYKTCRWEHHGTKTSNAEFWENIIIKLHLMPTKEEKVQYKILDCKDIFMTLYNEKEKLFFFLGKRILSSKH